MSKPSPLTPADSDLSDFGFMPLDVGRFRRSDLVTQEEPEAIVAAVLLWGAAWHSKPAASLSNDDRTLAQAAGFGRAVDAFLAIKEGALRGFIECSDGRLYHPVVAEKAVEAWKGKLKRLWRTECARVRKHNERNPDAKQETPEFDDWLREREASRETGAKVARDNAQRSRGTRRVSHAGHDEDAPLDTRDGPPEPELEPEPLIAAVKPNGADHERIAMSQATGANVERDNAFDSCARAEKGQGEGQGEGEGDSNRLHFVSSIGGDDENSTARSDDLPDADLMARVQRVGELAGLNLTRPATLIATMETLKAWLSEGIEFETTIVPTIETRTRESPSEPIYSLRWFDAAVRKAHAVASVGGRPHRSAEPRPAPKPIAMADDDDERVRKFRARLEYAVGEERYRTRFAVDHVALRVVDDRLLDAYFRTPFEEQLVTGSHDETTFAQIAGRLGLSLRTRVAS